jgi:hypothetical protein
MDMQETVGCGSHKMYRKRKAVQRMKACGLLPTSEGINFKERVQPSDNEDVCMLFIPYIMINWGFFAIQKPTANNTLIENSSKRSPITSHRPPCLLIQGRGTLQK